MSRFLQIERVHVLYPLDNLREERHLEVLGDAGERPEQLQDVLLGVEHFEFSRARAVLAHVGVLDLRALLAGEVLQDVAHGLALDGVEEEVLDLGRLVGGAAVGRGAQPVRHRPGRRLRLRHVRVLAQVDVAAVVALLAYHLRPEEKGLYAMLATATDTTRFMNWI